MDRSSDKKGYVRFNPQMLREKVVREEITDPKRRGKEMLLAKVACGEFLFWVQEDVW